MRTRWLFSVLFVSVLFNILGVSYISYRKWDRIVAFGAKLLSLDNVDAKIKQMNTAFLPASIEGRIERNSGKVVRILVVGNSLSYHPALESIGWMHTSGMAASSIDSDYVHLLLNKLSERKNLLINYKITNFASYERNFKDFDRGLINDLIDYKPDVVIFQLGENVKDDGLSIKEFIPFYISLVSNFSGARKIITTPFFPSNSKNEAIRIVADETNSMIVDLSHLPLLDNRNYAKSEMHYSHDGIGIHPGDFGMRNISELLFSVINGVVE